MKSWTEGENESGTPEQEVPDADGVESGTTDGLRVSFMLLVLGYAIFITYFPIRFEIVIPIPTSDIGYFMALSSVHIGFGMMVLSQVWYLTTREKRGSWETRELRDSLVKYVAFPVIVSYVVVILAPISGLVLFSPGFYNYAYSVLYSLPSVFFLPGAVYVTLFYVFKMA